MDYLNKKGDGLPTIPDVVCVETGADEEMAANNSINSQSSVKAGPLLEAINTQRLLSSSMDKTPSADREDELCFSEELNVTDEDDKGKDFASHIRIRDLFINLFLFPDEAFHSSSGSTYEQAINEAMMDESSSNSNGENNRGRLSSTGASSGVSSLGGPQQQPALSGSARSRPMPPGAYRQQQQPPQSRQRAPIGSDSTVAGATGRNQHSPAPPPSSSSPESRGHRVILFPLACPIIEKCIKFIIYLDAKTSLVPTRLDGWEFVTRFQGRKSRADKWQ